MKRRLLLCKATRPLCKAKRELCKAILELCRSTWELCRPDLEPCRPTRELCKAKREPCKPTRALWRAKGKPWKATGPGIRAARARVQMAGEAWACGGEGGGRGRSDPCGASGRLGFNQHGFDYQGVIKPVSRDASRVQSQQQAVPRSRHPRKPSRNFTFIRHETYRDIQ